MVWKAGLGDHWKCAAVAQRADSVMSGDCSLPLTLGFELPIGRGLMEVESPALDADPIDYATDPSGAGGRKAHRFQAFGFFLVKR